MEEIIEAAKLNWKPISLKRGDYLIQVGKVERYFYYVKSGALRAFQWVDDKEFTIRLAYKGSIVAALPAYFTGAPSSINIQAIRQAEVLRCSKAEMDAYFQSDISLAKVYIGLMEDLVASFYEREIDLMTHSPAERLKRILERSPHIFQEVPHKYIASYLRMSPETLSRLMKS